jgi:hypothetical protein
LQVQASTEGAAIPEIAGRVRIAGQIIWATKFKEVATTTTQRSGGGKGGGGGGGSVTSTTYSYLANFAVGLCEGPIDRIGRIWVDGKAKWLAIASMMRAMTAARSVPAGSVQTGSSCSSFRISAPFGLHLPSAVK